MILIIDLWMILMLNKHHPKVDDSCHQFMDVSSTEHPKVDDSCHQFMDVSSMEQSSSNNG